MTEEENKKCHYIIHTCAAAAGAGNVAPVPGLGVATDLGAMTLMAISLASVFGQELTRAAARGVAYAALKKVVVEQPVKFATKEAVKIVPIVGQIISASISVALTEAAGWQLAQEFAAARDAACGRALELGRVGLPPG